MIQLKTITQFTEWGANHPKVLVFFLAAIVYFPLFFSNLSLIDDHEVISFLMKYRADGLAATIQSLAWFPDLSPGQRFRPIYYVLRTIEAILYEDNAFFWAASRITMAIFFSYSVLHILKTFLPVSCAVAGAIFMVWAPWTRDVFFRFGPSEGYALLFAGLLIFFLLSKSGVHWLGVSFSIAMLIGIKENYVVLMPVFFIAIYFLLRQRKYFSVFLVSALLIFSLICLTVILQKLAASAGVDMYGKNAAGGRLLGMMQGTFMTPRGLLSLIFLSSIVSASVTDTLKLDTNTRLVLFFILIVAIFNLYFYGDAPSLKSRYAIPFWPMLFISSAFVFMRYRNIYFPGKSLGGKSKLVAATVLMMLGTFNSTYAYRQTKITNQTDSAISKISKIASAYAEIIVNVGGREDIEALASIAIYLDFNQVHNFRYLSVDRHAVAEMTPMMMGIIKVADLGSQNLRYLPLGTRQSNEKTCLEIYFHEDSKPVCIERIRVPYK